jgi:PKD repeat protein
MRAAKPAAERAAGGRGLWRLSALGRSLVVATLLAASLMAAFSFARTPAATPICACGLGNTVTMVANNAPALAYAPPNVATDAPAGIFALDYFINKPVTFYEDLSRAPSAPDPNSVKWRWDFGDGSPLSYQVKPTHTYATPGTYTVIVSVYEPISGQWGLFDNAIMKVIGAPFANPPVAKARAVTSSVIGVGDKISFDATGSHAADGSNATYQWNFGDNSVATGLKVTHQFNQAGRGFITLTVTDARGAKAIAQVSVVIVESNPNQPAKVTVSPTTGTVGAQFLFDASQTQPPADQPVAVAWDFGDGSPLVTTSQPNVGHIYHQPGDYTVSVGVYGQLGDGSVATIKAQVGPAAAVGPAAGKGGPNWLLLAGVALVVMLALAGLAFWLTQRKRAAAERQRREQIELARARRASSVNGGRGGGGNGPRRPPNGPSGAGGGPRAGAPTGAQGRQTTRQPYPPRRDDSQGW